MATGFPIIFVAAKRLWTPAQIPTAMWLDAADSSTVTLNGSNVSQWSDKSGNARHVLQATAVRQPAYNSTGLNGFATITANGSSLLSGSVTISNLTNTLSTFAVATMNSSTQDSGRLFSYQATGDANDFSNATSWNLTRQGTNQNYWLYRGGVSVAVLATTYAQPSVIGFVYNGTNGRLFEDGTESTAGARTGNFGTSGSFNIFAKSIADTPWNGSLSEVIMTTTALSTQDRQIIEGYLAWKWGTQASLPSNHPYKLLPPTV